MDSVRRVFVCPADFPQKTAKTDSDTVTGETPVTLGDFTAAVGWAYAQAALLQ